MHGTHSSMLPSQPTCICGLPVETGVTAAAAAATAAATAADVTAAAASFWDVEAAAAVSLAAAVAAIANRMLQLDPGSWGQRRRPSSADGWGGPAFPRA